MSDAIDLINKFDAREKDFVGKTLLAPVLRGSTVRVRLGGIVMELKVNDRRFEGYALLKVKDLKNAEIIGQPTLKQTAEYLKLFPRLRMVVIDKFDGVWWGLMFNKSDKRFKLDGPVPIRLVNDDRIGPFRTIETRCDGANFYYETDNVQHDFGNCVRLNAFLSKRVAPEEVRHAGLVPAERLAYLMAFLRNDPTYLPGKNGTIDDRIRVALHHAGAQLSAFWMERGDESGMLVRFTVDGVQYTCRVNEDLSLRSAGICLSGQDQNFDLASLVGVLRERDRTYGGYGDYHEQNEH